MWLRGCRPGTRRRAACGGGRWRRWDAPVATYVEILEPQLVVVGGGMSEAGAALFDPLSALVRAGVSRPDPAPVVPAGLGDLAGLHGAALLAWQQAGPGDSPGR